MSQYGEKSDHISGWNGARTTVTLSKHLNDHVILEDTKGPIKKRGPMEPCGEIMKNWYLGKTRKTIGCYFEDFKCLIHTQYIYLAYCQFKNAVSVAVLQNVKAIMSLMVPESIEETYRFQTYYSPPKKNLKKCTITQVKVSSHTNNDPVPDSTEVSEFLYI